MNKIKRIITYLVERLQEPSTIRGIVLLSSALGAKFNQELQSSIIEFGLILSGIIAILTPDSIMTKKVKPNKNHGEEEIV